MSGLRHQYRTGIRRTRADYEATRDRIETTAASDYVLVSSFTRKPTKSNEDAPYKVLIGAELCIDTTADSLTVTCAPHEGKPVVFTHVSSRSLLGPPYRVAVACTCYDWRLRSGFPQQSPDVVKPDPVDDRAAFSDAAAGCKHMMLCNAAILKRPYVTLGPSVRAEQTLTNFLGSETKPNESDAYGSSFVPLDPSDQPQPESMP